MEAFRRRVIALGPQERQCLTTIVREAERAYVYFENRAPHVKLVRREDAPLGAEQVIAPIWSNCSSTPAAGVPPGAPKRRG